MFRTILVLLFASAGFALTPVQESEYYKVYYLSDVDFQELKAARSYSKYDGFRSVIEQPYNGTWPADNGGNYGDMEFSSTRKNGTLIARDTIINQDSSQNLLVIYERTFNVSYVEDFKLLNFGRNRGWGWYAIISHNRGYVSGEILVAAGHKIRVFAETYVRVE